MKALFMLLGTLLLMVFFVVVSYIFSHKQLVSMQKKLTQAGFSLKICSVWRNPKTVIIKSMRSRSMLPVLNIIAW